MASEVSLRRGGAIHWAPRSWGDLMASEVSLRRGAAIHWRPSLAIRLRALRVVRRFFGQYRFNSITRRIIVLNFFGVAILVAGILYLNQYRVHFMETRVDSL